MTFDQWKAALEKDLSVMTPEGIAIQPLYAESAAAEKGSPLPRGEGQGEGEISTFSEHEAGADAADEIAIALARAVVKSPRTVEVAVGRDTFLELCKLRALRICFAKFFTALGEPKRGISIRARCSTRTLTQRDPWVNMLRATTQVFAAILGSADEVVPTAFDQDLGKPSELAERVARNTELILRHESSLGRVIDPASGSYYLDTLTDQLAREGWKRFQAIEAEGGIEKALPSVMKRIEAAWTKRLTQLASRRIPVLGVSEFANLDEKLPGTPHAASGHRDSEAFEALRERVEKKNPTVVLLTLGTFAESRARAGFSANFFAAGGFRTREVTTAEAADLVCLCGTDDRYATDAASTARELKKLGVKRVLLAGKPGANEASHREAGIDGFIFIGCDLIATMSALVEVLA
ncbi:MAG: hypothetical protein JNM17_33915 [Archangium sp.]|nr:hypothetical protein [Archangium sp.]